MEACHAAVVTSISEAGMSGRKPSIPLGVPECLNISKSRASRQRCAESHVNSGMGKRMVTSLKEVLAACPSRAGSQRQDLQAVLMDT